ncbi:MAG: hypothetical protein E7262_01625 [Lachnospiraceae bacterium]|nr:hypothetical protein [Lachnospiraceae bacterium]
MNKAKVIKSVIFTMLMSAVFVASFAKEAKADSYGFYTYTVKDKTATITEYTGDEINCVIPSKLGGYKVVGLGMSSFDGQKNMESVTIPSTVKSIGSYAFKNCDVLKKVTIPNSVTTLEYQCFNDCDKLETVTIGSGVKEIPNGAFQSCDALKTVNLTSGLKIIHGSAGYYGAFQDCTSLVSITLPSTLTEIGDYAFGNCDSLKEIIIPNSVKKTGNYTFTSCAQLQKVTIGTGLIEIADGLFYNCSSLKTVVFVGNNITRIGRFSFACTALEDVKLPAYVDVIEEFAFEKCTSLKNIVLNEGLMEIQGAAFTGCTGLEELTIPSSVIILRSQMLSDCKNLKTVYLKCNIRTVESNPFASVRCPKESLRVKAYSNNEFVNNINIGGDYKWHYVDTYMPTVPATSLTYSKKSVTIAPGTSVTLPATIAPADSTDSILYTSSNDKIATVNQRGKITAVSYGVVTITARDNSGHKVQLVVNVLPKKVSGFKDSARGVASIKLSWTKQANVDGYIVYRQVSGKWKQIGTASSTATSFIASKLASGTSYKFAINAYKKVNGTTYKSPSFPTVTSFTKPAKVTGFKRSAVTRSAIKTTWTKTRGATGYIVYRYKAGKWVRVATVKSNSYTFTKLSRNTAYKFCVKAYKTVGSKTEYGTTTTLSTRTSK